MKKLLATLFAILTLCSCSTPTPYASEGLLGGYSETPVNSDVVKVSFAGNGFTTVELAQNYMMRRAASLSKESRMPYFGMYASLADVAQHNKMEKPAFTLDGNQPTAYAYVEYHTTKQPGDISVADILNKQNYSQG